MDYREILKQYDGIAYTPKKRKLIRQLIETLFSADTTDVPVEIKTAILCRLFDSAHNDSTKIKEIKTLQSKEARYAILLRDKRQCVFCGKRLTFSTIEVDHDVPWSRGGTDHPSNLQATCRRCNREKGDLTSAEFRSKRLEHYTVILSDNAKCGMTRRGMTEDDVLLVLRKGAHDRPSGTGDLTREAVVKRRRLFVRYRIRYKNLIVVSCGVLSRKPRS